MRLGRRLYVADTINSRDYEYDLARERVATRVTPTASARAVYQQMIAEQVVEISTFFRFDAQAWASRRGVACSEGGTEPFDNMNQVE